MTSIADRTKLKGARTHNLKGVSCEIPHGKLTVITGVSGSGKSSLAFDTLYAEGQRRYTESLSTYARQFLQRMQKPPFDELHNIQPAVALKQKNEINNARSTVSTVTELDDHFGILFTHAGIATCPTCGETVHRDTASSIIRGIRALDEGRRLVIVAEVEAPEEEHRPAILKQLVQEGFRRFFIDRETVDIADDDIEDLLDRETYPLVIDRLVVRDAEEDRQRLADAVETALAVGKGRVLAYEHRSEDEPFVFDQAFRCNACGTDLVEPQPPLFSFNSSLGACDTCSGFGRTIGLDFKKIVPNPAKTIEEGALVCFSTPKHKKWQTRLLAACRKEGVPIDLPFRKLTDAHQRFVKNGGKTWPGVRGFFDELKKKQYKVHVRVFLAKYRGYDECQVCQGTRLSQDARNITIAGKTIADIWAMRIEEANVFFEELDLGEVTEARVENVLEEIRHRVAYLDDVGLGYLELERASRTLSGGEMQRIHLTTNLGRTLTDTLYVLDEPTAGLHARDSNRLLEILRNLRDLGNTVVVVEHDPEIIKGADYVLELGPMGGEQGGELVFEGDYETFSKADTLTAAALTERLEVRGSEPGDSKDFVRITGAVEHNLDSIDVDIPVGKLTAVTGVSGSGKSTLMQKVLFNGWRALQGHGGVEVGSVESLEGLEEFDDLVLMDQSALGRSSRSNALSYTKAYDGVRNLFADTRDAKLRGVTARDLSFNTPGGRCENCQGLGTVTVEMHFMADIEVTCEECNGKRFKQNVLEVRYRGKNIYDVFDMTVDEGLEFFEGNKTITRKLEPLRDVGLGYLRLGQTTSTLSGGEAQRVKLATYIADGRKRGETKPVFFIFDEPTVGLHLRDVETLIEALRKLIDLGHTVAVIEHNIDFIANCDWVIDLGPGAGPEGGELVAAGTPREVAAIDQSVTGDYLAEFFSV